MASLDGGISHKESLMNEINSLFAPPTAESYGKKGLSGIPSARRSRKATDVASSNAESSSTAELLPGVVPSTYSTSSAHRDDPFWRKPRPSCHEYCDSCGCTEGDRLVCDRCPASFHLECLDPPMDSDEAPIGVWFCHRCSRLLEVQDEEDQASTSSSQGTAVTETGSSRSSRPGRVGGRKRDPSQPSNTISGAAQLSQISQPSKRSAYISRALTNERALTGRSSRSAVWGESAYVADTEESELRTLWNVIKYAQFQNPKEFDLPKDLIPGIKLPGSYKTIAERKVKPIIDLENGMIPRPVRRCFVCSRTCMFAPLLPCDYCSACFHLECLDPPMPHFPPRSDRWMCPNHTEHVADRYLVRSIRLTERMRIWSELTKVSTVSPQCADSMNTSTQLVSVKRESEQEAGLSSDDAADDCPRVTGNGEPDAHSPLLDVVPPYELTYGPDEEASILASLMRRVQRGRAEHPVSVTSLIGTTGTLLDDERFGPPVPHDSRNLWRLNRAAQTNSRSAHVDPDQVRIVVPPSVKAMYNRGVKRLATSNNELDGSSDCGNDDNSMFVRSLLEFYLRPTPSSKAQSDKSSDSAPQQSTDVDPCVVLKEKTNVDVLDQLTQLTEFFNELPVDKKPKFDLHLIVSLAKQRLNELLLDRPTNASLELETVTTSCDQFGFDERLRARAVLTPCGKTRGPVVPMQYRKLTVGTTPDCHLRLTDYAIGDSLSRCPYASGHHATIFYDEWAHHFELLNYSEFGTLADGIQYGNEIQSPDLYDTKGSVALGKFRSFLHQESNSSQVDGSLPSTRGLRMTAHRHAGHFDHCCIGFTRKELQGSEEAGGLAWEGSAVLRHGSVVQFGCYQFVLALVDYS